MDNGPLTEYRDCDECGKPVPYLERWEQVVEGGAGLARGHRACIEAEWGPVADRPFVPGDRLVYRSATTLQWVVWTRGDDVLWRSPDRDVEVDDGFVRKQMEPPLDDEAHLIPAPWLGGDGSMEERTES